MEGSVMVGDDVKWHGLAGVETSGEKSYAVEGRGEAWTGTAGRARTDRERTGQDRKRRRRKVRSGKEGRVELGQARQERRGLERNEG